MIFSVDRSRAPYRACKPELDLAPLTRRAQAAWRYGESLAEAGDLLAALPWLDRAHRLAPSDQNLRFALAWRRLQAGDPDGAAPLFADMALRFGSPECWAGLAACRLATGDVQAARDAVGTALSTTEAGASLANLAGQVAGRQGWVGLGAGDTLLGADPVSLELRLDGASVAWPGSPAARRLPPAWRRAHRLDVLRGGEALLGSPILIATINRLEGVASRDGNRISGCAWHPAAPARQPELRLLTEAGAELARLTPTQPANTVDGTVPLARLRQFSAEIPTSITVRVVGPDGRDLLGSPLPPDGAPLAPDLPPHAKPAPRRDARPGLRRDIEAGSRQDVEPPRRSAEPDPRQEAEPDSRRSAEPDPRQRAEPDPRQGVEPDPRHGPKPDPRLEAKPRAPDATLPVNVVIPVYRGLRTTLDCIASVLATLAPPHRVTVVNDASPEPELSAALRRLAQDGHIHLLGAGPSGNRSLAAAANQSFPAAANHSFPVAANLGFPAAVNAGLRAAPGHHAILLNSDTLVAPSWLETLRDAACSAADIGTATPLSNEASIFCYPKPDGGNPAPDLAGTIRLAALAVRANAGRLVEVPTAHGFCMFVRADCLAETGLLDEQTFAQGYGEENDFTERARALGWRHVAVPSVFVAHLGGVSFGPARADLLARNLAILERRYPTYRARVAAHISADPLAASRRRLDAARWVSRPADKGAVLLVTHGGGGGTTRIVAERATAIAAEGFSPVILRAVDGLCEVGAPDEATPNLVFETPRETGALIRLLRPGRPVRAELHHLLGHNHAILGVIAGLGIPYDAWVHDYAWFCARISFTTGQGRFCGEADPATCETCLARWGRGIEDKVAPAELRRRSAGDLARAHAVIVPSADVARRVARHAPGVQPIVRPWEEDPPYAAPGVRRREAGPLRVAVIGAIGQEKGYDVLLACARDAAARALDLAFTVVGYTEDDDTLMATGRVFVTGEFTRSEARGLIVAQRAQLAFLPSVWPETWCYALSDAWSAGLSAAVFDIGTPAERVRSAGRGWVLPLGLPPALVCDALLRLGDEAS